MKSEAWIRSRVEELKEIEGMLVDETQRIMTKNVYTELLVVLEDIPDTVQE